MRNLQNTKNKLTLFFVVVVFLIILIFSISGALTKYIGGYNFDKINFLNFVNNIEKNFSKKTDFIEEIGYINKFKTNRGKKLEKIFKRGNKINYIFLSKNGEIKSSNIQENITDEFIAKIIKNKKYFKFNIENSFFIKKIKLNSGDFIVFEKIKYDSSELFQDIGLFFIINLFFCVFVYFFGKSFINKVFKPVEENIDDMKNFVHNAGHELKTPISVMDSDIQLLLEMKTFDKEMILEMKNELKNMNSLINSLINLSDIGEFKKTEKNHLKEIVEEIIKNNSLLIEDKNIKTNIEIGDDIIIEANKNYFSVFLSNLIKNAIKYNKKDGNLKIIYKKGILKIIDTGIGISEKDKKKIFDRFFKADKSRNSEGFGIGLSLVKKIADIYSWEISVKSEEKKGSEFHIKF